MKYEVLKLKTGQELCGMVSYTEATVEITLPMICQLTRVTQTNTLATFIPYAPLSHDPILSIGLESIMHTSPMNEQFVPFYDEASSRWLRMVEDGNIPLTNKLPSPREFLRGRIEEMIDGVPDAELDDWELEEHMMADDERILEDFMSIAPIDGKKIIH